MTLFRLGSFAALLGITFTGAAFGHAGEVHGGAPLPPTVQTAPRATAARHRSTQAPGSARSAA